MNEEKINKLFRAVRAESAPEVPFHFSQSVLASIRRGVRPLRYSLADQLSALFPRIALSAAVIVMLCMAADIYVFETDTPLAATVEQVAADEWLVAGK